MVQAKTIILQMATDIWVRLKRLWIIWYLGHWIRSFWFRWPTSSPLPAAVSNLYFICIKRSSGGTMYNLTPKLIKELIDSTVAWMYCWLCHWFVLFNLAKHIRVAMLRPAFIAKYLGNNICWHWPNVWRGKAKYNAKPDTKVIQIWAPKLIAKDPKYPITVRPLFSVKYECSSLSTGHVDHRTKRTIPMRTRWAGCVVLVRIL